MKGHAMRLVSGSGFILANDAPNAGVPKRRLGGRTRLVGSKSTAVRALTDVPSHSISLDKDSHDCPFCLFDSKPKIFLFQAEKLTMVNKRLSPEKCDQTPLAIFLAKHFSSWNNNPS